MKDIDGNVLYVGKAKNLQSRIRQYFQKGGDERAMIPYLRAQVEAIDTVIVLSEKEALLLENTLIKKYQPRYNALLKDDKAYLSVRINTKEPWPMMRIVRKGDPPPGAIDFGPYTKGYAARETLEIIRRLFPLRSCSNEELKRRTRPCILYEMKRCLAPCVGKCTTGEYQYQVGRAIQFLRGHSNELLDEMTREMKLAAEDLEFEKAAELLKKIEFVQATLEKQHVNIAGKRNIDALGLYREADLALIAKLQVRHGNLIHVEDFLFSGSIQESDALLTSFIMQHYQQTNTPPKEILLPFDLPDEPLLEEILPDILFTTPKRGEKKALSLMAFENASAHFHRKKDHVRSKEELLMALEETCQLNHFPERIECFDLSNLGGSEPVGAMVLFVNGEREKKSTRTYKIQSTDGFDDYGALEEVLRRRYRNAANEGNLPDCILIDGGKGHLNRAMRTLEEMDISTVDLLALAKEDAKHTHGLTQEQIFLPGQKEPLRLQKNSPVLFFLQSIRDEVHETVIRFQRKRRGKKTLQSALSSLPGIGPMKEKRLLQAFGSLKRILEASDEELLAIPRITKKDIANLRSLKARWS